MQADKTQSGAGTSSAAMASSRMAASGSADDESLSRQVFLHLILVCCTKSPVFARHFAAKSELLSVLCEAAIKKVEEIGAIPAPDADCNPKAKANIPGIPPWVNCVMGIGVAIARLQPEKPKADAARGQAAAQDRDSVARSLARHARDVSMGRRAQGQLSAYGNDSLHAAERQTPVSNEEMNEERTFVNRLMRVSSQRQQIRSNARRRAQAAVASTDAPTAAPEDPGTVAELEAAANDAASAEAMVTDEGPAGGGDEATGAHKRDLVHTRLAQIFTGNWRPCGLLTQDEQSKLTSLCCAVVTAVRKHAAHMPLPALESLTEEKIHSSEHPRGALFATLQLMTQLARSWSNAQAMVAADMPRCLMAMPAPALCTGALSDISRVVCCLVEDPDVNLPVCNSRM